MTSGKKCLALLFLALITHYVVKAQSQFQIWGGSLGAPVYKQDFGTAANATNIAGAPLPPGITSFTYSNSVCPPEGSYSIVHEITDTCSANKWHPVASDHNSQVNFGNMMLVHNIASLLERVLYVDTVNQDLCANTLYEFSAAIINIDALGSCSGANNFPSFRFTLEDASGKALQSYATPELQAYPPPTSAGPLWKYSIYGFDYPMPANMNKIILKITVLPSDNNSNCYNDFAIDDVLFSPAGAKIEIFFDQFPDHIITPLCFQDNKSVSFTGNMDAYYANPAFQWEQTTDNGLTWKNIPAANSNVYSQNFPLADTFLFRLRGSEASNIGNRACGVVSNTLKVEVNGIPSDFKASNNSPICSGEDLKFTAEGGASYTWSGPNGFFDNSPFAHIYHSILADSGTYYVEIITVGGCKALDSTHVIMRGLPEITAGPDTSICKGQSVNLICTPAAGYEWSPPDGLSSTSISNPIAKPQTTVRYTVKVFDENNCSASADVNVKILNDIEVKSAISGSNYLCRPFDSANFFNASLGKISSWKWNFDNGQTSLSQDPPTIQYAIENGRTTYNIKLTVSDSAGCTDSAYYTLKVVNNCYIAVPTAFTPNGDGINDYLYPLNAYKATNLIFRVYDRAGKIVFETSDWTKKWDGSFKGMPQPAGVFVWTLEYNDAANKRVTLKGATLLTR